MKQLPVILLVLAALLYFYSVNTIDANKDKISKQNKKIEHLDFTRQEKREVNKKTSTEIKDKIKNSSNLLITQIPINQPTPLSYKSKKEIYDLRKHYVKESIFDIKDYEPSEEVFGQIEDHKPWVSMKQCKYEGTGLSDIEGPSEEARFINNPAFLVAVDYAFYGYKCGDSRLNRLKSNIPMEISYDKGENTITVTYSGLPYCNTSRDTWYSFTGINARDLGYKYLYVDKEKSTFNVDFVEDVNAGNTVVELQDFIHVGGSCSVEGGCNNGSPNQPPLNFVYPCTHGDGKRIKYQKIFIKLWKEKPESPEQEADINEKIILRSVWVKK